MKRTFLLLVKRLSYQLGLLHLYLMVERKLGWKRTAISLCYHSIPATEPLDAISTLEGGTCRETFESQIKILAHCLQPIDESHLHRWLNQEATLQRDALLITFDDGYKNNQTVAGPILEKYQVPGLIFLPTEAITTGENFWWTRVSNLLRHITPSSWQQLAEQPLPAEIRRIIIEEPLTSWESRRRARRRVALWIERQDDGESLLTQLETEVDRDDLRATPPQMELLNWQDVQDMETGIFGFGSHTHTHPRLTTLDDLSLKDELTRGRAELEKRTSQTPRSLAYPAGNFDQRITDFTRKAGFALAFTTEPGIIEQQCNPLQLPRLYLGAYRPFEIYFFLVSTNLAKYMPHSLQRWLIKLSR